MVLANAGAGSSSSPQQVLEPRVVFDGHYPLLGEEDNPAPDVRLIMTVEKNPDTYELEAKLAVSGHRFPKNAQYRVSLAGSRNPAVILEEELTKLTKHGSSDWEHFLTSVGAPELRERQEDLRALVHQARSRGVTVLGIEHRV